MEDSGDKNSVGGQVPAFGKAGAILACRQAHRDDLIKKIEEDDWTIFPEISGVIFREYRPPEGQELPGADEKSTRELTDDMVEMLKCEMGISITDESSCERVIEKLKKKIKKKDRTGLNRLISFIKTEEDEEVDLQRYVEMSAFLMDLEEQYPQHEVVINGCLSFVENIVSIDAHDLKSKSDSDIDLELDS